MALHHEIDADLIAAFFTCLGQEDYVAIQGNFQAMQQQQHLYAGNPMALVVRGTAAVQETVADQTAERIDGPLLPLHADCIDVPHDQQRLLGAAAADSRHKVSAAGYQFEDL